MTKFSFSLLLMGALMFFFACNPEDNLGFNPGSGPLGANPNGVFTPCEDGTDITPDDLPDEIRNFLSENYPGFSFDDIEQYLEAVTVRFGIEIEYENEEIEFYFESDGSLISFGDDQSSQMVAIGDLPASILDYLEANFPDIPIEEAEIDFGYGMSFFEIELADGTELYFSEDGSFLCNDNDGDDDDDDEDDNGGNNGDDDDDDDEDGGNNGDDDDDNNNIPAFIYDYLQANYPNAQVDDIDQERLCGGAQAFEVELENENIKLYFDTDGNFLFSASRIGEQDLPQAVMDAISNEYAGYQIHGNHIKEFLFEDGSKQYQVELELFGNDDDEIQVLFSENGSILCSED